MTDAERRDALTPLEDVDRCEDCGERFNPWDARAEIVRPPAGEVLVVHAECMREGDTIA